eukprot:scaffold49952_cov62-Phaeocystis_antarctica.AAC.2
MAQLRVLVHRLASASGLNLTLRQSGQVWSEPYFEAVSTVQIARLKVTGPKKRYFEAVSTPQLQPPECTGTIFREHNRVVASTTTICHG